MGAALMTSPMDEQRALAWADALVVSDTGAHLNELQRTILQQVWLGKRYSEIAQVYGCTEGHAKDAGSDLWKLISTALGEKVNKSNYRAVAQRHLPAIAISPESYPPVFRASQANFVGRSAAIAQLDHFIATGVRAVVIQGEGGLGKTTLAQEYLEHQGFDVILECLMAKDTIHLTPAESVVEEWLTQDLGDEPGSNFGVTLARLKRHLKQNRIGILIDNLEPALDRDGLFIPEHRDYCELLRVLTYSRHQSITLITSRDRLCESVFAGEHYRLQGLSQADWHQYFEHQGITVDSDILSQLHPIYGGNAKAMALIAGHIKTDFDRDLTLYWQWAASDPLHLKALKHLVAGQIDRLASIDVKAYRLLCRLGCYRFQERPYLEKAALAALLWDVEPIEHNEIIQSLCNRSLVEFQRGQYWLHPVIRAEAIARIRNSEDWILAHRHGADYWTQKVTQIRSVDEALDAWEAYYHYLEIQAFEEASQVILQSRHNQWQQYLPLGSILYRMGLSKTVLNAIESVIQHVSETARKSELHNILGDLHWITGKLHQAIAQQKISLETASHCLKALTPELFKEPSQYRHQRYYLQMLKIDSLLSLGLYSLDLWELAQAQDYLEQVIQLGQNSEHTRWSEKASIALALIHCHQERLTQAQKLIAPIDIKIQNDNPLYGARFAYFIQLMGQVYVGLQQYDRALNLFQKAIAYSIEGHYPQIQGLALNGMAMAYRHQQDFQAAIACHHKGAAILERIGATCDLATVHLQWSITLKLMNAETMQVHAQKARQLFQQINAHQQIHRFDR